MTDAAISASGTPSAGAWVDDELLRGDGDDVCLWLGGPVSRGELRKLVSQREKELTAAGLSAGGTATFRLPPSLAYIASLLAAWRIGAQVSLLDYRLTEHEVTRALERLEPQVVVSAAAGAKPGPMRAYADVTASDETRPSGRPAATAHSLIQLSSGSTGPSKVIARTAPNLLAELRRYTQIDGYPGRGDRMVLLASVVHVLGLVGGLLYSLYAGVQLRYPERLTGDGILQAVSDSDLPTTVLGVPFHAELLNAAASPRLPQLTRMIVAGELVRPGVTEAFVAKYGVPLGTMYGMTELGVIATDLDGTLRPAVRPAPGMRPRVVDGELQIQMDASPYIGLVDPTRWADGWLHTRDAATIDERAGLVTVLGRLDSQVAIGGLKVDLTEVEQTLSLLPGVAESVVVYDSTIKAYLTLRPQAELSEVEDALAQQLAAYKRPRELHVVTELPRTATGKILRDRAALRALVC